MTTPINDVIRFVAAENDRSDAVNLCFIYFVALAETRRRGYRSDLFDAFEGFKGLTENLPQACDDAMAIRLRELMTEFIEKCPQNPNVPAAFRILHNLSKGGELKSYFISKLKYFYGQGDAHTVFAICIELEDMGVSIFRDENGVFMLSRSSSAAETNMGVARRFLERQDAENAAARLS